MSFSFAKMLETDISKESGGNSSKRLVPGTYSATIAKVTAQVNETTGAESKVIEYLITDNDEFSGSTIRQFINTKTGNLAKSPNSDNAIGYGQLRRLFTVVGYSSEQISKFRNPKNGKDVGDFIKLMGKQVTLTVKMGKPRKDGPSVGKSFLEVADIKAPQPLEEEIAS